MMRCRKSIRLPLYAMNPCQQAILIFQSENMSIERPLQQSQSKNKKELFQGKTGEESC